MWGGRKNKSPFAIVVLLINQAASTGRRKAGELLGFSYYCHTWSHQGIWLMWPEKSLRERKEVETKVCEAVVVFATHFKTHLWQWLFDFLEKKNGSTCSSSTRIKSLTKHSSLHMQCLKMAHKVSVYRIVIKLLSFFALTGNLRMQFFGGKDSHQSVVAFSFHWISRQHRRE